MPVRPAPGPPGSGVLLATAVALAVNVYPAMIWETFKNAGASAYRRPTISARIWRFLESPRARE